MIIFSSHQAHVVLYRRVILVVVFLPMKLLLLRSWVPVASATMVIDLTVDSDSEERNEVSCSFMHFRPFKIVWRRVILLFLRLVVRLLLYKGAAILHWMDVLCCAHLYQCHNIFFKLEISFLFLFLVKRDWNLTVSHLFSSLLYVLVTLTILLHFIHCATPAIVRERISWLDTSRIMCHLQHHLFRTTPPSLLPLSPTALRPQFPWKGNLRMQRNCWHPSCPAGRNHSRGLFPNHSRQTAPISTPSLSK